MRHVREVKVRDLIAYFAAPLVALVALWTLFALDRAFGWLPLYVSLPVAIVLTYAILHFFVIGIVLMYKAFAPRSVRDQCRFEPTCSTYMILAIRKYGLLVGLIKGIRRICRCKPPNGGIDYP